MTPSRDTLLILTTLGAVGSGLIAGLLFTFSNNVMPALLRQPTEAAMRTMQTINALIQNPWFFIAFFGTAIVTLFLAIVSAMQLPQRSAMLVLAGSLLYLIGTFGVTAIVNVPMNNGLAAHSPIAPDATAYWQDYVARWVRWNHLRTVAALAAAALLTWAVGWIAQAPKA